MNANPSDREEEDLETHFHLSLAMERGKTWEKGTYKLEFPRSFFFFFFLDFQEIFNSSVSQMLELSHLQ